MTDTEFGVALVIGWTIAYMVGLFIGRHTK